jgi:ADP-ribosylglycohydrolase
MEFEKDLEKEITTEINNRIKNTIMGMVLGHQMGQWSERRWWGFTPNGETEDNIKENLFNNDKLRYLIDEPPLITTPGWVPTGFVDMVPHVCALGMEYVNLKKALTPEDFRDFLLRERTWLRPQGVGRSCMELMGEGMNPRIAGLFSPSIISGCWVAWPSALYNAGNAEDAYEDAVKLARTQNGGDVVTLTGLLAAMIAVALTHGTTWLNVRDTLLQMTGKRGKNIEGLIKEALAIGSSSKTYQELANTFKFQESLKKVCAYSPAALDGLSSFYFAIACLEFSCSHDSSWSDFVQGSLSGCDNRFGAMISVSIRAAIDGTDSMPELWSERVETVHHREVELWIDGTCELLHIKNTRECENANEILLLMNEKLDDSVLYDKILAAMLAGAIGNVMGSPVEDRDYPWIIEKYGVLDRILDPKALEREDDSAMAVMWAETYIRCNGRIYPEDLAETFRSKMNKNNFYYDSQHAYNLMIKGLPPHACGHWNVVTGSGLMGCNPCGMYHAGNPENAAADALELAYHYQRGFDVHAPAILCAATAEALRKGATVDSILEAAINAAPAEKQVCFNRLEKRDARLHLRNALAAVESCTDVLSARKILYDGFLEYNGQDPWEVVAFTLAIFKVSKGDVWQSMIGGTNIGRDSDTISSQAAILSACMQGMKGVPSDLLKLFSSSVIED